MAQLRSASLQQRKSPGSTPFEPIDLSWRRRELSQDTRDALGRHPFASCAANALAVASVRVVEAQFEFRSP